jgi:hypothetical protein
LQARAFQGCADAPVHGWQVIKQQDSSPAVQTCQPCTNPFNPYREYHKQSEKEKPSYKSAEK